VESPLDIPSAAPLPDHRSLSLTLSSYHSTAGQIERLQAQMSLYRGI
jgi:hypothetical protein